MLAVSFKDRADSQPMRKRIGGLLLACTALSAVMATPAMAAKPDAAKGKAISAFCSGCHGSDGIATNTSYPDLAGQNYKYLVNALGKYKRHERNNGLMNGIASGLSTEQIQDLAAYYSSVPGPNCPSRSGNGKSQSQ